MSPTEVYDTYWRFAAERQSIYVRRLLEPDGPWTKDPILAAYRFTNAYRAADRVSQFLIANVQYGESRSQAPAEVFFRTLLFKFFNKIETWELLEDQLGPLSWQAANFDALCRVLDAAFRRGMRLYSAAYIMPAPGFGHDRKHANHLALLSQMMEDGLPASIGKAKSLRSVFEMLLAYPGLGPFLAYQYAIDLNYSSLLGFSENDFVVAGPGALDGLAKCFADTGGRTPEEVIAEIADRQETEFRRLDLKFEGLFGRPLQLIDCQNLFCEISKYARVRHPEVAGISNRKRIKQGFRAQARRMPIPQFPPRWGLIPALPKGDLAPASFQGRLL
ncbi:nucleotide kinase domain-containing protein [Phenylobacterium sp.]|uniref:nucleotide kinase domain-containing protein n=1 Tax=Phenylobacterium sp. TaxID=1871053 RepID=UPI0012280626|nr:nucleotide kinase domain-containing protein [Phenylobacterium sp.]THD61612.1 MAG: hypothetical protein E8A49_11620 [Phenylobacterium sp.]